MDTWVASIFWLWKIMLLWTWLWTYLFETLMPSHTVILNIYMSMCVYVCLVTQSRLTLHDPMDCSPPDSSVHGILQPRILEWVAISFTRGSSWPRDWTWVSCISCTGRQILTTVPPGKPMRMYIYVCVSVCETESESCPVVSDSLQLHRLQSIELSRPEYWMGSLSLLQGIFPTQGSYSGLSHYRQILCQLSHKGSPRILEWVAHPFSSGSSWPRNWTRVSCIAGGFFTNWARREALYVCVYIYVCVCVSIYYIVWRKGNYLFLNLKKL